MAGTTTDLKKLDLDMNVGLYSYGLYSYDLCIYDLELLGNDPYVVPIVEHCDITAHLLAAIPINNYKYL